MNAGVLRRRVTQGLSLYTRMTCVGDSVVLPQMVEKLEYMKLNL